MKSAVLPDHSLNVRPLVIDRNRNMEQDQREVQLRVARFTASVAATVISLACGTNVSSSSPHSGPFVGIRQWFAVHTLFLVDGCKLRLSNSQDTDDADIFRARTMQKYVYSAWAPQFAEKLKLSATQSNMIGQSGNLGMYLLGIPVGMSVDRRGPRPFVLIGAVLLVAGYFPLHMAYNDGAPNSVVALCFFSFLTGLGSCMSFAAAVKTSALNWPFHRGTATAFPLAAFGLSAFFFSSLGALLFPGDPNGFLKLLSCGTFSLICMGFLFLRVYPQPRYHAVIDPNGHLPSSSNQCRVSQDCSPGLGRHSPLDPGTSSLASVVTPILPFLIHSGPLPSNRPINCETVDEFSELISPTVPEHGADMIANNVDTDRSRHLDIRGLKLLRNPSFWLLFTIMAILSGVGLMTINNIGNDVNVLWKHHDQSVTEDVLIHYQQMHVSILSLCSFGGRLLSGVGSDFLATYLHASRMWCLLVASFIFLLSQASALVVNDPHFLGFVSGLSGLGYGFLFGVFPSLVAEAFGIRGLSQNWGSMTLAPVISSNIFNSFYGAVLDSHSVFDRNSERSCHDGRECYRDAYWATFGACFIGIAISLWAVQHERAECAKEVNTVE